MPSATGATHATTSKACGGSLQQEQPDDYVLATGEAHSVRELVEHAFAGIGRRIEWQGQGRDEVGLDAESGDVLVEVDPGYFRPTEVDLLLGDPTKARTKLGWKHRVSFAELIAEMVESDLELLGGKPVTQEAAKRAKV